jgi:hypothetical protein
VVDTSWLQVKRSHTLWYDISVGSKKARKNQKPDPRRQHMIPNISTLKVIDTLQFFARFSEVLLEEPDNQEAKEQIQKLISEANKIVSEFYQIEK